MKRIYVIVTGLAIVATSAHAKTKTPKHYATGLIVPADAEYGVPFLSLERTDAELPAKFDLRDQGLITSVKNQQSCGSCWAFAGIAAMESAVLKNKNMSLDLSEQEIVSCDTSGSGCSGGWQPFDYMVKKGIGLEANFPYRAQNTSCKTTPRAAKALRWGNIGAPGKRATVDEVKKAVVDFGALWITVGANSYWSNPGGSVLNRCSNSRTNHAVTVAGFETDDKGKTNFLIKNSWGTSWNGDGYVKTPLGCNNLGETVSFVVAADSVCAPPEFGLEKITHLKGRSEISLAGLDAAGLTYTWEKVGGTAKNAGIGSIQPAANEDADYIVRTETACGTWSMMTHVTAN